jgi:transposase
MRTLSRRHRVRSSQGDMRPCEGMRTVNPHAAGVARGAHASMAGVPDGDDQQLGRAFGTSTADLASLADWCIDRGLQTGALASTGVYWIPLCETLEARGIQGCLISAQAVTHVPGRKSDVLDCP